eukprot:m.45508 g.45508  ORF g.45508 m.45508 type:complete len:750 (-) comp5887_c0_seq1:1435-3684(-)
MHKAKNPAALREALSLWEKGGAVAPLSQAQQDTILDLAARADDRPLPDLPPGDPEVKAPLLEASTESTAPIAAGDVSMLRKVDNAQQFFAWFEGVEVQMESDREQSFRAYLELLKQYSGRCDDMLSAITSALHHLTDLETYYSSVSTKTSSLHNACEQLLQDQTNLANYAEAVSSRLSYFVELERLSQKLNSPTLSVLNEQFVPLLNRLDDCIKYISEHHTYKDAQLYLSRFLQLQGRGLNLVKTHVINTLKMATQNVQTQVQGTSEGADVSFTLFYGKFRLHAPRIKALMVEIERRALNTPSYSALLQDCYDCYFSQRLALLRPAVVVAVRDMLTEHQHNLPALMQAGCAYMGRVCTNEHQLHHHFFSSMNAGLSAMLEALSMILYDACRPLYIQKSVSLDTLVELCVVLKAESIEDRGEETAAFVSVAEQMLQDVQQRLVFVSQSFTVSQIKNYDPEPTDLNYPERLQTAIAPGDEKALFASWYPTLPRALLLLSKLSRCLNKGVFDGLAQEVVGACLQSLRTAGRWISIKQGVAHGQLFLVKHLILLREQTAPFEVDTQLTEFSLDFSHARDVASNLLRKGGFSLDSLANMLVQGAPHVTESRFDFRKEVDVCLRDVCQEFIRTVSKTLTAPLLSLLVQVDALPNEMKQKLSEQPFARPERLRDVLKDSDALLHGQLKIALANIATYLGNKDTERILFRPIKAAMLETYAKFAALVAAAYNPDERAIIACPTMDQVALAISAEGAD